MDGLLSILIAFLAGVATGSASTYFGYKYTDRRREQETTAREKRKFRELQHLMGDLFDEMRNDLKGDDSHSIREFLVLDNAAVIFNSDTPRFRYNSDRYPHLRVWAGRLLNAGFVAQISNDHFRMTDRFAELLAA